MGNPIGARQCDSFKAVSTAPSINKTPVGCSTPPLPYPTVQDLANSVSILPSVLLNGDPVYVLSQSTQPSCKLRDGPRGTEFKASDGEWYPLKEADMAHRTDAVKWWNETGRQYGAKAPEVRTWMLDSKNYVLDHFSLNRSAGASLPDRYLPPLK